MKLMFGLYPGSSYTSSGSLQTSWGSWLTAARLVGQVNNADSTSNNWHITGVQLEVGTYTAATLPPFQFESYGDNLARCQRYYEAYTSGGSLWFWGIFAEVSTYARTTIWFKVTKRANPTVAFTRNNATGSSEGVQFLSTQSVTPFVNGASTSSEVATWSADSEL